MELGNIYNIFLKNKSNIKLNSKDIKKGDIFLALKGQKFDGNDFIDEALKNGAVICLTEKKEKESQKVFYVDNILDFIQKMALKYREDLKIPVFGLTGSNGKTTSKELIWSVLSKKFKVFKTEGNLNNHYGVPLSILSIKKEHQMAIIEMGANHVGEIKLLSSISRPNFGAITNIGKAHIGEFGSFENIIKGKTELYDFLLNNRGKIFLNPDDEILMGRADNFKKTDKIFYFDGEIVENKKFLTVKINGKIIKTKLVGSYNLDNLRLAYTVGIFFNIEEEKIIKALEEYYPKNNRSQFIKTDKRNEIILDCYNANPSSMAFSINSFKEIKTDKEKIFILGGMKELGVYSEKEHEKIKKILEGQKVFFVGPEFRKVKDNNVNFYFFEDVGEIKDFLKKRKIENKLILLKGSNSINLIEIFNKNLI